MVASGQEEKKAWCRLQGIISRRGLCLGQIYVQDMRSSLGLRTS